MKATPLLIPDVILIEPQVLGEEYGFFFESLNRVQFKGAVGKPVQFLQDNRSSSVKNVLRGLHYQNHQPKDKLVKVVQGDFFDVAVEFKKRSDLFGQWMEEIFSAENKRQPWLPEIFTHGFIVLSEITEILYKTTDYDAPALERCILRKDPTLPIRWSDGIQPILSTKDAQGKGISEAEVFA